MFDEVELASIECPNSDDHRLCETCFTILQKNGISTLSVVPRRSPQTFVNLFLPQFQRLHASRCSAFLHTHARTHTHISATMTRISLVRAGGYRRGAASLCTNTLGERILFSRQRSRVHRGCRRIRWGRWDIRRRMRRRCCQHCDAGWTRRLPLDRQRRIVAQRMQWLARPRKRKDRRRLNKRRYHHHVHKVARGEDGEPHGSAFTDGRSGEAEPF